MRQELRKKYILNHADKKESLISKYCWKFSIYPKITARRDLMIWKSRVFWFVHMVELLNQVLQVVCSTSIIKLYYSAIRKLRYANMRQLILKRMIQFTWIVARQFIILPIPAKIPEPESHHQFITSYFGVIAFSADQSLPYRRRTG